MEFKIWLWKKKEKEEKMEEEEEEEEMEEVEKKGEKNWLCQICDLGFVLISELEVLNSALL